MAKHVDALLVINNERLRDVYSDLNVLAAFGKADDTLSVAAKSIAEIITVRGVINLDFQDVKTVLKDGGIAIMSTGYGEGEGRVKKAIQDALHSPLLNNNDVYNSKRILLSIAFNNEGEGNQGLRMEEMNDVNDFMSQFNEGFEIKWGLSVDPDLGDKVKVTLLATGFGLKDIDGMNDHISTRDKINIDQKAAEDEERLIKRRNGYYGEDVASPHYHRPRHIFIFKPEELDNEDVILKVDDQPTYRRTSQQLQEISRQSSVTVDNYGEEKKTPVQGTIRFDENN